MLKIYLAGKFTAKDRIRTVRDSIVEYGLGKVTSTWVDEEKDSVNDRTRKKYARRDLAQVKAANLLIIDTVDESITGGREVEYGVALGTKKKIWLVGPKRNIFHHVADGYFANWDVVLNHLKRQKEKSG